MLGLKRVLIAALLFAVAAGAVSVSTARADDEPKSKGKGKKPDAPPAATAEPGKPIIIQLDASKLPPEVLKELLKLSKSTEPTKPAYDKKPEPSKPTAKPVKSITLAEAIAIAEKITQGTAAKA